MLVLSRKLDESIQIGNDIKITIVRVKGNTIRIGIDAPTDIRIVRSELKSIADAVVIDEVSAGELVGKDACCEDGACHEADGSSTVTAIVDSPALATNRLFVGKVTNGRDGGNLQSVLSEVEPLHGAATLPLRSHDQAAPLRAFLLGSQGLTAV